MTFPVSARVPGTYSEVVRGTKIGFPFKIISLDLNLEARGLFTFDLWRYSTTY